MKSNAWSIKLSLLAAGIAWIPASFAAPVTWHLSFYETGDLVGAGDFTYDEASSVCVEYTSLGCTRSSGSEGDYLGGSDVATTLDSISINLSGLNWGSLGTDASLAGVAWWKNASALYPNSGLQLVDKSGNFTIQNRWLFYDDPTTQSMVLNMDAFKMVSNCLWTGAWGTRISDPETGDFIHLGLGTFKVTREGCEGAKSAPVEVPLPTFEFSDGVLNIPTVMVSDVPYTVRMQLQESPEEPLTFSLIDAIMQDEEVDE